MLDGLTNKFTGIFSNLGNHKVLTEAHIEEGMREIRRALLEADVNLKVAKDFIKGVKERAIGEEVIKNVRPADMLVKIVQDELTNLMGPVSSGIPFKDNGLTIIMMAGLQGSGKTTTCGKLANRLKKKYNKSPMLVAADLQRPAAIEQLKTIGGQVGVPVYSEPSKNPVQVCQNSLKEAKAQNCDVVILDTAGRLHIDDALMDELAKVAKVTKPDQVYLVCDSMTGQDAVNSAGAFNEQLELDGVILTKLDGDARGGAALSVKAVTGKPIKFMGVGEKLDQLDEFHPERIAGRILGMGDIAKLVDIAQEELNQEEQEETLRKMMKNEFTLMDFQKQMKQVEKMGSFSNIIKLLPGMGNAIDDEMMAEGEKHMRKINIIINSMTPEERVRPDIINSSRKKRIAKGASVEVRDVTDLLREFKEMRKMMKGVFSGGGLNLPGMPKMPGGLDKLLPKGFSSNKKMTEDKLEAYRKSSSNASAKGKKKPKKKKKK